MSNQQDQTEILARIRQKWDVDPEPLAVDGSSYELLAIRNMTAYLDRLVAAHAVKRPLQDLPLWAKVWPGSIVLGRFLRKFEPQGKTLLELGCGMGVLAMVASAHGFSHITATDIEKDALDFATFHMLKNGLQSRVDVKFLDVSHPPEELPTYDMIAASELLYLDHLHRPLLKFLDRFLVSGGKAFFCTDLARLKPHFQKQAARHLPHFHMTEGKIGVKSTDTDGSEQRRIFSILILEKP